MSDFDEFVSKIGAKPSGQGYYLAKCPAHDDKTASLSVREGDNGKPLVSCFAGCEGHKVVEAFKQQGVWPKSEKPKARRKEPAQVDQVYKYYYENGSPAYEKVRYVPKDFRWRKKVNGEYAYSIKDTPRTIYNINAVLALKGTTKPLIFVEGEKDVDTLTRLGFVGTTVGAVSNAWEKEFNKYIKDLNVILIPDCDPQGFSYVQKVGKVMGSEPRSLRVLDLSDFNVSEKKGYDLTDWVNGGGDKKTLTQLIKKAPKFQLTEESKEKDKKETDYEMHIQFVQDYIKNAPYFKDEIKRCLFSKELLVQRHTGEMYDLRNLIDAIRGAARDIKITDYSGKQRPKYQGTAFKEYIERYKESLKPELAINIPEWDGRDRISEICSKIYCTHFSQEQLKEMIITWGAKAYLKIYNSETSQSLLLFVGSQGVGKDVLIEALTGGLQRYARPVIITDDATKLERALSGIVVANLAEFDKLNFTNVSLLKDIVTKKEFYYDEKYMAGTQEAKNRVSFIGSSNTSDFLKDWTGNRRYWIIELDDIEMSRDEAGTPNNVSNYPGDPWDPDRVENRAQIFAQFVHYANTNQYGISASTKKEMDAVIGDLTPEDPKEEALDVFWRCLKDYVDNNEIGDADKQAWIKGRGWISNKDCLDVQIKASKMLGVKLAALKRRLSSVQIDKESLKVRDYYYDGTRQRGWKLPPVEFGEIRSLGDFEEEFSFS